MVVSISEPERESSGQPAGRELLTFFVIDPVSWDQRRWAHVVPNPATGAYPFSKSVRGDRCVIAALKTQSSCLRWPWRGGEGKRRASDVGLALMTFLVKEFKIPVIEAWTLGGVVGSL